jgi:hypothetical protein
MNAAKRTALRLWAQRSGIDTRKLRTGRRLRMGIAYLLQQRAEAAKAASAASAGAQHEQ